MDFDKVGGRKFVLSIIIVVISTVLVGVKGSIDPTYAALLIAVLGAFGVSNVLANRDALNAGASDSQATDQPPVSPVEIAAHVTQNVLGAFDQAHSTLVSRVDGLEESKATIEKAQAQLTEVQAQIIESQQRLLANLAKRAV